MTQKHKKEKGIPIMCSENDLYLEDDEELNQILIEICSTDKTYRELEEFENYSEEGHK